MPFEFLGVSFHNTPTLSRNKYFITLAAENLRTLLVVKQESSTKMCASKHYFRMLIKQFLLQTQDLKIMCIYLDLFYVYDCLCVHM